jgi:hypothetical protein
MVEDVFVTTWLQKIYCKDFFCSHMVWKVSSFLPGNEKDLVAMWL